MSHSHVLAASQIREKGQVTLPKEVMERLNVKPNDEIQWIHEDNHIIVEKVRPKK